MCRLKKILQTCVLLACTASIPAQKPSEPLDSLIQPFTTREEVECFLRTAPIVKEKGTPVGVTVPRRLTLDDGRIQHDALFKVIDERKLGVYRFEDGSREYDFKDSWKFEVAAYELDKLLALDMVPVTVERTYKEKKGSLQWWVEGMSALDAEKKKLKPPRPVRWQWQLWKVWIFDKFIFNIDRNLGNILVTPDWRLVMIDHSRCFKSLDGIQNIQHLKYFSRSLMKALEELDEASMIKACGTWLTGPEIKTTMARRDLLVRYYKGLLEEQGPKIAYP